MLTVDDVIVGWNQLLDGWTDRAGGPVSDAATSTHKKTALGVSAVFFFVPLKLTSKMQRLGGR